ncbi:MAG: DUF413 domain-containing protein [Alteromonadaceae bacterium]|nr:DUF413 domain-containing protein [Alteromonadaceae bacterium]
MAKLTRDELLNRSFMDPKNFPYGFSRSGDFSINEAKALTGYGNLITALLSGSFKPSCPEDEQLLAVAKENAQPSSYAEKAWVKYQKRINRVKTGSIYGKRTTDTADAGDDSNDDEPLDTEIDISQGED